MRLSRTGQAVVALSIISVALIGPDAGAAARDITGTDFDRSLTAVSSLLLLALSMWALACVLLSATCDKTAVVRAMAHVITPKFAHRALFLGAAGALAVSPVSATTDTLPATRSSERSVISQSLDGLQLPDRPIGTTPAVSTIAPLLPASVGPRIIRVARGDTLWSIAANDLTSGAQAAEIAGAVTSWHRANRTTIGADPDLIFPHQLLIAPPKETR